MNSPLVQPDPGLFIWTIAIFLVLLVLLGKYAWGPLLAALERRQEDIRKSLDDAQQAKQELERVHEETSRLLAEARREADGIISRTRADASRVRDELKEKAQTEAASLVRNATQQIDLERARAVQQIRREAADLSVAIASKVLQREISRADNERLIEDTFRQLETTAHPP